MSKAGRDAFRAALLAVAWVGCAASQPAVCPAPGAPVAEPYRWYPKLDLSRIPFHTAAGPWGPRAPITAPAPPVTRRTVEVTSAAQLAAEARIPGTQIVVAADYIVHAAAIGDVTDVDIVVPRGRVVGQLSIGRNNPPSTTQRVRIRGSTPGVHSGGLIGAITFHSVLMTDIIIDGVDLNGADGNGGTTLFHFGREPMRAAVVNNRGHGVGPASLHTGGVDVVIAGNRFVSGARPREVNGYGEGWGIRGGGGIVVFDNRIDGTSYHRVRVHPRPGPPQYAWVADNTFVDPNEARIFNAFDVAKDGSRYSGVWAVCNRVYAHSTCMGPSFQARDALYVSLTSNAFFRLFHGGRPAQHTDAGRSRKRLSQRQYLLALARAAGVDGARRPHCGGAAAGDPCAP